MYIPGIIGSALYYAIDGTAKVLDDVDGLNNTSRLFHSTVQLYNLNTKNDILPNLLATMRSFCDFTSCRSWLNRLNDLISGKAAGLTDNERINLGEGVYIPNVIGIANRLSLLISDVIGLGCYLGTEVKVIDLAKIANQVASLPVFGAIATYTMNNVRATFGVVGYALSVIDSIRDIADNGLITYDGPVVKVNIRPVVKIIGDIAKIASIALFGLFAPLYFANAAAATASIMGLVFKKYDIKNLSLEF